MFLGKNKEKNKTYITYIYIITFDPYLTTYLNKPIYVKLIKQLKKYQIKQAFKLKYLNHYKTKHG